MKHIRAAVVGLVLSTVAASTVALAAEPAAGQREYQNRCQMCHGATGQGDGWMAQYLINRPPTLTQLKKNNGGKFPAADVYEIIIGRKPVKLHGPREMPVWGTIYRTEQQTAGNAKSKARAADERTVRAKIRALTDYVEALQE
jgi:mono/diheme cytochrome c family protein